VTVVATIPAVTVTAAAAATPTRSKTDANTTVICGVMMAAFDHVDAVTTNYLSNNGTSSLSHVQETVTDVDDMLDEIGFYTCRTTILKLRRAQ